MISSMNMVSRVSKKELNHVLTDFPLLLLEKELALSPMLLDDQVNDEENLFLDVSMISPKEEKSFTFSTLSETIELTGMLLDSSR